MKPEAILLPMVVLALWTGVVLVLTGLRRLLAVKQGRLHSRAFALGESAEVPAELVLLNRNLMNLLEMPVLFYVVVLASVMLRHVALSSVVLAWVYVGLRLVHSAIHLTYNRVFHRFLAFATSNVILLVLWIGFLVRVLHRL
jgi:hypothetical protein